MYSLSVILRQNHPFWLQCNLVKFLFINGVINQINFSLHLSYHLNRKNYFFFIWWSFLNLFFLISFFKPCILPIQVEKTEVSAEDKEKAEQFKLEGNGFMKQQKFDDAIQSYNKAIEIDPKNAVFYCNR